MLIRPSPLDAQVSPGHYQERYEILTGNFAAVPIPNFFLNGKGGV